MSVSAQLPGAGQKINSKDILCLRSQPLLQAAKNCFYTHDMHGQDSFWKVNVSKKLGGTHLFL